MSWPRAFPAVLSALAVGGCRSSTSCPESNGVVWDGVEPEARRPLLEGRVEGFLARTGQQCLAEVAVSDIASREGELWLEPDGWHVGLSTLPPFPGQDGADLYRHLCTALLADGALDATQQPPWGELTLFEAWADQTPEQRFLDLCTAGPTLELTALTAQACSLTAPSDTWSYLHQEVFPHHSLRRTGALQIVDHGAWETPTAALLTTVGDAYALVDDDTTRVEFHSPTGVQYLAIPHGVGPILQLAGDLDRIVLSTVDGPWIADRQTVEWTPPLYGELPRGWIGGTHWVVIGEPLEVFDLRDGAARTIPLGLTSEQQIQGLWNDDRDPEALFLQITTLHGEETQAGELWRLDLGTGLHRVIWRSERVQGMPILSFRQPLAEGLWLVHIPSDDEPFPKGPLGILHADSGRIQVSTDACPRFLGVFEDFLLATDGFGQPSRWLTL